MSKFIANFPSQAGTRVAKITGTRKTRNINTGDTVTEVEVTVLGDKSQGEGDWQEYYDANDNHHLGLKKF